MRRTRVLVLLAVFALALGAAACGDDEKSTSPTTAKGATTAPKSTEPLTASFRGVTADSIKIGIPYVDYKSIEQYVDETHGDQKAIYQAVIDDINENGGVLGRKLVPVFKEYVPIDPTAPNGSLALCTVFTQDEEVFAVLGVYIDFSGDSQLCLTRDKETIHIGHELDASMIEQSIQGLLLTPDRTSDRSTDILLNVLDQEGTLDGKKVAIMADSEREGATKGVEETFDKMGVDRGSTAVLAIAGEDTAAAQSQLDAFLEKWDTEGVDALFVMGLKSAAEQFIVKVKDKLPDLQLIFESDSSARTAATKLVQAGTDPNPYEGALVLQGQSETEQYNTKAFQDTCLKAYKTQTGKDIVDPADWKPGADGSTINKEFIGLRDACDEIYALVAIAEKAGPNLTNDTWIDAVNSFGPIKLSGVQPYASFGKGKYEADDGARLAAWNSSISGSGDYEPVTDLVNTAEGSSGDTSSTTSG